MYNIILRISNLLAYSPKNNLFYTTNLVPCNTLKYIKNNVYYSTNSVKNYIIIIYLTRN